ncbi:MULTISPECIES: hypothetical protein [Halorussus]|uniref:hypothetical protein n=1 Tax=Halorussus TaxID=1070314 RepID=UPI0020A0092A|nr:hypothetical protein [Halorussus vallis]USZ75672.1 hypothetical protein NGM07_19865 [Halorussus vallis]USZ75727.1 hypothetical protein NGM07_20145 [Halorussus vallis]USZ75746.1 hypothetical protein NGM07_00095 [Halorussus vallis]
MDENRRNVIAALAAGTLGGSGIVVGNQYFQQSKSASQPQTTIAGESGLQAASAQTETATTAEPTATTPTSTETTTETSTTETSTTETTTEATTTTTETTTEKTATTPEPTTTETTTEEPTPTPTTTPDPESQVEVSFWVVQSTAVPGTIYGVDLNNDNDFAVRVTVKGEWEWGNGDTPTRIETYTVGAYDTLEERLGTPALSKYETLVSHDASVESITKA